MTVFIEHGIGARVIDSIFSSNFLFPCESRGTQNNQTGFMERKHCLSSVRRNNNAALTFMRLDVHSTRNSWGVAIQS